MTGPSFPCDHRAAYVVAANADIGTPLSETVAHWECPKCGAKGESLLGFDAAADDLRSQTATKH